MNYGFRWNVVCLSSLQGFVLENINFLATQRYFFLHNTSTHRYWLLRIARVDHSSAKIQSVCKNSSIAFEQETSYWVISFVNNENKKYSDMSKPYSKKFKENLTGKHESEAIEQSFGRTYIFLVQESWQSMACPGGECRGRILALA